MRLSVSNRGPGNNPLYILRTTAYPWGGHLTHPCTKYKRCVLNDQIEGLGVGSSLIVPLQKEKEK